MSRIFRLPTRLHSPLKQPRPITLENEVRQLLEAFESAEEKKAQLRKENGFVFDMIDALNGEQDAARDSIKRLLHTKDGPPPQVQGRSSHVWARGRSFFVEVSYKKKSDYYDIGQLPPDVFLIPNVVVEVDKGVLDTLAKGNPTIAGAKKKGAYMTPAVSISRANRGNQTEDGS